MTITVETTGRTAVRSTFDIGPYKFFDYFVELDEALFAGRDDDVTEVVARITRNETLVLFGRSGLGKTSLLLAGVFPQLRRIRRLDPILVRTLDEPLLDVRNAVAETLGLPRGEDAHDLHDLVKRAESGTAGGLVLVCDQFEEFFIRQRQNPVERRAFAQEIGKLVRDPGLSLRVVFSLREDFVAEMEEFRTALPDIFASTYRLLPLTAYGARQAIIKPLSVAAIEYDQPLVAKLVDLLAPDFDPFLLQIACTEVYREAKQRERGESGESGEADLEGGRARGLKVDDLEAIGGLDGLFGRYLALVISRLPHGQVLLGRAVLDALISGEDTKRAVTLEELTAHDAFAASTEEVLIVLDFFRSYRLVRLDQRAGKDWYELSHERLVKSILDWFRHDPDFSNFRMARSLIANATRTTDFRTRLELLLAEDQVKEFITPYRMRLQLTDVQREFMFWSAVYRRLPDVRYWADLFGLQRAADVVLMLLTHPNDAARLGAATAAGAIRGEEVAAGCLKAALDDKNADVRRAAAHSFASIADPTNVQALKTALTTRRTRGRAFAVLTELHHTPAAAGLSRYWRMRAALGYCRRAVKRAREEIRDRTIRGALAGLLAAVAWAVTSGFAFVSVQSWTSGSSTWAVDALIALGLLGLGVIFAGPIVGAVIARIAARRAAFSAREGRWLRSFVTLASFVLVITLLLGALALTDSAEAAGGVLLLGAAAAAGVLLVGAYVAVFRRVMWPATRTRDVALWGVLIGFGLPLIVMIELLAQRSPWELEAVVAAWSFLATVMAIVLTDTPRADRLPGIALPSGMRTVLSRSVLVVAAVFAPLFYLLVFGRTSVPFAAPKFIVGSSSVPIQLPEYRDISYFTLRPADRTGWSEVASTPENLSLLWGSLDILGHPSAQPPGTDDWSTLLRVPRGGVTLIARRSSTSSATSNVNTTMSFRVLPELSANAQLPLDSAHWTPFVVVLKPTLPHSNTSVWKGKLALQSADPSQDTILRIAIPWNGDGRVGTLSQGSPGSLDGAVRRIEFSEAGGTPFTRYHRNIASFVAGGKGNGSRSDAPQELSPVRVNSNDHMFDLDLVFSAKSPEILAIPVLLARQSRKDLARASHERCEQLVHSEASGEALPYCEQDADLDLDDALYLTEHALALLTLRRSADALPLARKAADLVQGQTGMYVDVFDTLARAEYDNGNWALAVQAWQKVYALAPNRDRTPSASLFKNDRALFEKAKQKAAGSSQPQ